jgi:hypothetical protein
MCSAFSKHARSCDSSSKSVSPVVATIALNVPLSPPATPDAQINSQRLDKDQRDRELRPISPNGAPELMIRAKGIRECVLY